MPLRPADLDPEREQAVTSARAECRRALETLANEAARAAKAARGKRATLDLPAVYAAARAVERAEEAYDLAAYDLATASGEDG